MLRRTTLSIRMPPAARAGGVSTKDESSTAETASHSASMRPPLYRPIMLRLRCSAMVVDLRQWSLMADLA
jgi:hypothetical protein